MSKGRKPRPSPSLTAEMHAKRVKLGMRAVLALFVFVLLHDIIWASFKHTLDLEARVAGAVASIDAEAAGLRAVIALAPTAGDAATLPKELRGRADWIANIKTGESAPQNSEKRYAAKLANSADFTTLGHAVGETGTLIIGNKTKNQRFVIAQLPIDALLEANTTAETRGAFISHATYEFGKTSYPASTFDASGFNLMQWPPSVTKCQSFATLTSARICLSEPLKAFQIIPLIVNGFKLFLLAILAYFLRRLRTKPTNNFDAKKLGKALDMHDVAYWQFDATTFIMNGAASARLGFVADAPLTMQEFLAHVPGAYHAGVLENFRNGTKEGFVRLEIPFSIRDQIIWMAMEGHGVVSDGTPILAGTFHNITHIYARMMESGVTSRRLQEALNLYAGPFALWDSKQRLIFWNGAFERDFGLSGRVQMGQTYDRVSRRRASSVKSESMVEAEPDSIVFELFSDKFIKVIERRVPNQGMITLGVDITENVKNQQALSSQQTNLKSMVRKLELSEGRAGELTRKYAEEKKKAERAAKSKTDFLSNMSHELRTPLNAINGFSEMINTEIFGPVGDPRYKEYAGDIHASGQHLLEMINDILDMAKIEAGKMTINAQPLDPVDPVKVAMRMVHGRAREKGIKLLFMGAKGLPEIKADHRAIRQMILNLTSNAIKFTAYGGEVRVRVDHGNSGIVFAVEDTGVGIPQDEIGRLAKPFEQASTTQDADHEGTGLGLALTKAFTDLHNGRFYIESELGVGTVVAFELPLDPEIGLEANVHAMNHSENIADVA